MDALQNAFKSLPFEKGKPSVIIANTIKGKGISFMENNIKWHHGVPNKEQYEMAMSELDNALTAI
jgi:transketolase